MIVTDFQKRPQVSKHDRLALQNQIFFILSSVLDPKLLITDPDPDLPVGNQEFRIRIRILETIQLRIQIRIGIRILPLNYRLIKKDIKTWQKFSTFVIFRTKMGIFYIHMLGSSQ